MKRTMIIALSVLLIVPFGANVFAQDKDVDISGTWVGETDLPATPGKDPVVLVLKKEGAAYTGSISVGNAKDCPLEKLALKEQDTITFEFALPKDEPVVRVSVKLQYISDRILGKKLMGAWSLESGEYGLLELEMKK